jgi:hypothetical protein
MAETRKQRRDQRVDIGHPQPPRWRDGRTIACLIRKAPDIALGPVGVAKTAMSYEIVWMHGAAIARKIERRCDDEVPNGGNRLATKEESSSAPICSAASKPPPIRSILSWLECRSMEMSV